MTQQLDVFQEFKEDHRKVRDTLFELKSAFQAKDPARAREILGRLNELAGPHFRFEEETLYPALSPVLEDYVSKLITDHDGAVVTARQAAQLVQKDAFSDADVQAGVRAVLSLLPHVSDCDGLAIFMETLDAGVVEGIAVNIRKSREEGLPLLEWADTVRGR